ncbi:MAG TPA: GH25 family lysozyme [Feifaniaceae bacterium]|nr:GH25 family lysozyme [Feifaniaceae bacterium]
MKKRLIVLVIWGAALLCGGAVLLLSQGIIWFQYPSKAIYPVRGVDVSAYQGEIDWETLSGQDIQFAFLKATEGSTFVDKKFSYNWEHAHKAGLRAGAYHYMSFDSPGLAQAENYMRAVSRTKDMLPPAVDLELYGKYVKAPPPREQADQILGELLSALEEAYGLRPIIYATRKTYDLYLKGGYENYDVWIRNVLFYPYLSDGREWSFWQYSNRGRLKGYDGEEKFIDLNVFRGTAEEFEAYGR